MRIKHALLCALTGATLLAAPVQASELTKSDVEQIVRDYLVKNPEILVEMSNALRAKQESQQAENDKTLIEAHAKQLFANKDPESGNPKGSLTVAGGVITGINAPAPEGATLIECGGDCLAPGGSNVAAILGAMTANQSAKQSLNRARRSLDEDLFAA